MEDPTFLTSNGRHCTSKNETKGVVLGVGRENVLSSCELTVVCPFERSASNNPDAKPILNQSKLVSQAGQASLLAELERCCMLFSW